jgi:hypothetical protein
VEIDKTSKFAYAEFYKSQTKMIAAEFCVSLLKLYPIKYTKYLQIMDFNLLIMNIIKMHLLTSLKELVMKMK